MLLFSATLYIDACDSVVGRERNWTVRIAPVSITVGCRIADWNTYQGDY
jgi:hypothetical protein